MKPEEQERLFNTWRAEQLNQSHDEVSGALILSFSVTRIDPLDRAEWEQLRLIRNACAEFMTEYREQISERQQERFREQALRLGTPIYLARANDTVVGFGMVTDRVKQTEAGVSIRGRWITLGLLPEHRGKGYGVKVYEALIGLRGELYAEIGNDNIASRKAAIKAGYKYIGKSTDWSADFYLGTDREGG